MRLIYAVLILLLALVTSAQCQKTAVDWFNKGSDFYDRGYYDLAIKCYDKMILIDPDNATAWNSKGYALYSQGEYEDAIKAYDEAIRLDPNLAAATRNRFLALRMAAEGIDNVPYVTESSGSVSGQIEATPEAEKMSYGSAIGLTDSNNPVAIEYDIPINSADDLCSRGNELYQQGEFDSALNAFDECIELNPQNANAWNGKGEVLRDQGKLRDAVFCFEKSKELDPDNYAPWYNEVIALIDSKSYIDKKLVRIQFDNSPTYTITYEPQSVTYVYDISLEIAAKLNPQLKETASYWYYVGASYNLDGDQTMGEISTQFFNKAIDAFNKALEIDPNYQKALLAKDYARQQISLFGSSVVHTGPGGSEWVS